MDSIETCENRASKDLVCEKEKRVIQEFILKNI